jgi:hypothetical protein
VPASAPITSIRPADPATRRRSAPSRAPADASTDAPASTRTPVGLASRTEPPCTTAAVPGTAGSGGHVRALDAHVAGRLGSGAGAVGEQDARQVDAPGHVVPTVQARDDGVARAGHDHVAADGHALARRDRQPAPGRQLDPRAGRYVDARAGEHLDPGDAPAPQVVGVDTERGRGIRGAEHRGARCVRGQRQRCRRGGAEHHRHAQRRIGRALQEARPVAEREQRARRRRRALAIAHHDLGVDQAVHRHEGRVERQRTGVEPLEVARVAAPALRDVPGARDAPARIGHGVAVGEAVGAIGRRRGHRDRALSVEQRAGVEHTRLVPHGAARQADSRAGIDEHVAVGADRDRAARPGALLDGAPDLLRRGPVDGRPRQQGRRVAHVHPQRRALEPRRTQRRRVAEVLPAQLDLDHVARHRDLHVPHARDVDAAARPDVDAALAERGRHPGVGRHRVRRDRDPPAGRDDRRAAGLVARQDDPAALDAHLGRERLLRVDRGQRPPLGVELAARLQRDLAAGAERHLAGDRRRRTAAVEIEAGRQVGAREQPDRTVAAQRAVGGDPAALVDDQADHRDVAALAREGTQVAGLASGVDLDEQPAERCLVVAAGCEQEDLLSGREDDLPVGRGDQALVHDFAGREQEHAAAVGRGDAGGLDQLLPVGAGHRTPVERGHRSVPDFDACIGACAGRHLEGRAAVAQRGQSAHERVVLDRERRGDEGRRVDLRSRLEDDAVLVDQVDLAVGDQSAGDLARPRVRDPVERHPVAVALLVEAHRLPAVDVEPVPVQLCPRHVLADHQLADPVAAHHLRAGPDLAPGDRPGQHRRGRLRVRETRGRERGGQRGGQRGRAGVRPGPTPARGGRT